MTHHIQIAASASILSDPLCTPEQTARVTGRSLPTLQRERSRGDGIPFVKVGPRRVAYRLSDIEAYLAARVVKSTSDARERGLSA